MSIFLIYVAAAMLPLARTRAGYDLTGFGRLPVRVNARVQPIDSAARVGLLQIRGTVTVPTEDGKAVADLETLISERPNGSSSF